MAENETKTFAAWLPACFFWGFILVKVWGTAFLMWSWWWVLLPFVPWIGLGLHFMGLL